MLAKRSTPRASVTHAMYDAADATSRPGYDVDPPYPGRSQDIHRMPSRTEAGNKGTRSTPTFGVPWHVAGSGSVVHLQRAPVAELEIVSVTATRRRSMREMSLWFHDAVTRAV
jgi:hypothetical protein